MTDEVKPPQWTLEHDHTSRLARLSEALTDVLEHHPDSGPDVKGIFALMDGHGSGAAMVGYQDHITTDPIFDLIRHAGILFSSMGVKMSVVADNGTETKRYPGPGQPEPPSGWTGEPVKLVLASEPGSKQAAAICKAVKEGVRAAEGDWENVKVLILIQLPDERSSIMSHGLDGSSDALARALLGAFQQVVQSEGGDIMLVSLDHILGTGPN